MIIILGVGSVGRSLLEQIGKEEQDHVVLVDSNEHNLMTSQILADRLGLNFESVLLDCKNTHGIKRLAGYVEAKAGNNESIEIYLSAAYKHVGFCEKFPLEAWENNVGIVLNVILFLLSDRTKLVLISTDKAVFPTTVMGMTKRYCECLVQAAISAGASASIVRFGNVLASDGSVIPIFQSQIRTGSRVTVTSEETSRFVMSLGEAAELLRLVMKLEPSSDPYLLTNNQRINILELAKNMILASGNRWRIISSNSEVPTPKNGYLDIELIGMREGEKVHEVLTEGNIEICEGSIGTAVNERDLRNDKSVQELSEIFRRYIEMSSIGGNSISRSPYEELAS